MAIPRSLLEKIQTVAPDSAWKAIFEYTWDICSAHLTAISASKEVIARDTAFPFAKALGFGQRSDLENNRASQTHRLQGAQTDCVNLPWMDCLDLIGFEPNWVLWHQWPDSRIHDFVDPGKGLGSLAAEAANNLTSSEFWTLLDRLSLGRQLVITSEHGYAASGLFSDAPEEQAKHLKSIFKSGRSSDDVTSGSSWFPPVDLVLASQHGQKRFVLGRRKWRSAGGYPTLTHGGLSVLEMASPFIKLFKVE